MAKAPSDNGSDSLSVPWIDIVKFVRQLSHDLANNLNAVELQSAYIDELAEDAALKGEIKRLREMVAEVGVSLKRLTVSLGQTNPTFMLYRAADFVEDLRRKLQTTFANESANVTWEVQVSNASLNIDPQLLQQAFIEIFTNAFQHERGQDALAVKASINNDRFAFALREPKARFELSTENWGREPLRNITRGHYGLGLNRVRAILEAHDGEFRTQYDPTASALLTTVTLPLSDKQ